MIFIAKYLKKTWAGVLFFTLFVWFAFHLVHADRGYLSYKNYKSELLKKEVEYSNLNVKRRNLETKVKYMRPYSIDPDLLDEQVRYMLGHMGENEFLLPMEH